MSKIILHGGRHKSGTTAIQRFLKSNPALLDKLGYYYTGLGVRGHGHHKIAELLTHAAMRDKSEKMEQNRRQMAATVREEISKQNSTLVFSSEAFQNCDPGVVKHFFGQHEFQVVFYIREQVSYLISAYAQKIHATRYTGGLEEFYHNHFGHGDYDHFLRKWHKAFGESLTVRVYERKHLVESNVVYDFCSQILGIDQQELKQSSIPERANHSLTQHLLEFKRRVNSLPSISEEQHRNIFMGLSELASSGIGGPVTISKKLVEEVTTRYRQSNTLVAQQFFDRDSLFEQPDLPTVTSPGPTAAEIEEIRCRLIELRPSIENALTATIKSE